MHAKHDVAVVGAGPAGAWTAYRLARGGARVVLLDPSHPREKPCGGGVTGRALALVSEALRDSALPAVRVRTVRFVDARIDQRVVVPLSGDLVIASRAVFDGRLLDAARRAGVLVMPERVVDVTRTDGGMSIRTGGGASVHADLVVGADGANSLVRRRLSMPFTRAQLSIATGFFAHGVSSDEVVIEFVGDPPGYIWSFPRPDHLAIGICGQADAGATAGQLRTRVRQWLSDVRLAPADARLQAYAWPIPSLGAADFHRLEIAGPRWMLAGDAAGLVDPLTREGICFALQSAEIAAAQILDGVAAAHSRYVERVRQEIFRELARAARFKAGFFRPEFTRLLIGALAHSPAVSRIMADLVAGTQGYASLKWRLLRTLDWSLAWQLLRLERGAPRRTGRS